MTRLAAFALFLASAALARGATAPAWGAAKITLGAEGESLFKVAAPDEIPAQDEGPDAVDVLRAIAAGALSAGTNAPPPSVATNAPPAVATTNAVLAMANGGPLGDADATDAENHFGDTAATTPSSNAGFSDGIDRDAPNFVTASLLIMSPGDELYSCAGHAAIRLECPTFGLDYCFSYESESVKEKVLTFFMGKLKMGMFAVPTADWVRHYREMGRGIMQYRLNLPPDVKQRLWKNLDGEVAKGPDQPYDCFRHGCAQSVLTTLLKALGDGKLEIVPWPDKYSRTRREFVDANVRGFPWNRFFLYTIIGTEADWEVGNLRKVVIPGDLLEFLRTSRIGGVPVIDAPGVELLSPRPMGPAPAVTPLTVSWLFAAVAVANAFLKWRGIVALFMAVQTLAGLFFAYLVFVSDLPATGWNWLVVPFNPLPALFWRWRRHWALGFAAVLVAWEAFMLASPHRLTDSAYLVLVAAYVVFFSATGWPRLRRMRETNHGLLTLDNNLTQGEKP